MESSLKKGKKQRRTLAKSGENKLYIKLKGRLKASNEPFRRPSSLVETS